MKSRVIAARVVSVLTVCSALSWSADVAADSLLPSDIRAFWALNTEVPRVSTLVNVFGDDLLVLGRVDAVLAGQISVLGQQVVGLDISGLAVGDYVAVFGERSQDGIILAQSVVPAGASYVAGASSVFVRGTALNGLSSLGTTNVGDQVFDLTPTMSEQDLYGVDWSSTDVGVTGVQPLIGGLVLARDIAFANKPDGSLGTGRSAGGSLGTGFNARGSLGTGKSSNGSLGTGESSQ